MARVRPLLEIMGDTIVHVGPPGQGIRMKLINNLLAGFTNQASADAIAFALKLGLPFDKVMEVLTGTAARTGHLSITWPNKIFKGDDTPGFSIALQDKDVNLALRLAESIGAPLDLGEATRKSFEVDDRAWVWRQGLLRRFRRRLREGRRPPAAARRREGVATLPPHTSRAACTLFRSLHHRRDLGVVEAGVARHLTYLGPAHRVDGHARLRPGLERDLFRIARHQDRLYAGGRG